MQVKNYLSILFLSCMAITFYSCGGESSISDEDLALEPSPEVEIKSWAGETGCSGNKLWLIDGITKNRLQNDIWRSGDRTNWRKAYKGNFFQKNKI